MTISYITGDATDPIMKPALIMHVCNDIGGWGRGFVLALSKRWPEPEALYRRARTHDLGTVQYAVAERRGAAVQVVVANMIAQHDIRHCSACGHAPIRYDALARCLEDVHRYTRHFLQWSGEITIHAPRIGSGLAGGDWTVIEALIEKILWDRVVYIYDLPGEAR